jgi:ABC-type phosphate transport system auxiliary subunit
MWNYMVPILVFMIPITAILANVAKRWIRLKERQLDIAAQHSAESAAQYAAKIATLEERVAVLNRIVTDRNEGLAVQIEALRDEPKQLN